ncbi:sugar ABC transporter ATP-binding protein [Haematomicrobium sanguinis]|uniref:sugar ABC transporter ATP-binding protein n=1 Tax=Haematomicrobium sanguinis TaxID=479106 RepID=UPI00047B6DBD|nr:sugar ABC transporter ATP-binding protein [Haematomicrobium sanguinis]
MSEIPLLQVDNLSKSFHATRAVDNASFDVNQGEIVSLLGENGAGKSTVIKMLAGVYKPDSGSMKLAGQELGAPGARDRLSIVHQNLGLTEWMTVAENIALTMGYPRSFGLINQRKLNAQAEEILANVGGGIDPEARVFDLPRAERSLLAIARALMSKPKLLILDEPTASLPHHDVDRLFEVLHQLRNSGVGMIYVSHRLDEIYQISSRTVIMRNGRVVAQRPVSGLSHGELVELIVGRDAPDPDFSQPGEELTLEADNLTVGDVGPVSFQVHRGEVLALCGLRGAGQEHVGRAIAGALKTGTPKASTPSTLSVPSTGRANAQPGMRLNGQPYTPDSVHDAVFQGVGFATSNRETEAVAPGMSISENLYLNPRVWGWRGLNPKRRKTEDRESMEHITRFGVRPPNPELSLDTLSGGNQQKVILARWFGVGRDLIVLEEPTMGVDVGAKSDIYAILAEAAKDGTSAVVVSTDMEEVAKIAHRAIVFGRGQVVAELSGTELTVPNLVAAASDLESVTTTGEAS